MPKLSGKAFISRVQSLLVESAANDKEQYKNRLSQCLVNEFEPDDQFSKKDKEEIVTKLSMEEKVVREFTNLAYICSPRFSVYFNGKELLIDSKVGDDLSHRREVAEKFYEVFNGYVACLSNKNAGQVFGFLEYLIILRGSGSHSENKIKIKPGAKAAANWTAKYFWTVNESERKLKVEYENLEFIDWTDTDNVKETCIPGTVTQEFEWVKDRGFKLGDTVFSNTALQEIILGNDDFQSNLLASAECAKREESAKREDKGLQTLFDVNEDVVLDHLSFLEAVNLRSIFRRIEKKLADKLVCINCEKDDKSLKDSQIVQDMSRAFLSPKNEGGDWAMFNGVALTENLGKTDPRDQPKKILDFLKIKQVGFEDTHIAILSNYLQAIPAVLNDICRDGFDEAFFSAHKFVYDKHYSFSSLNGDDNVLLNLVCSNIGVQKQDPITGKKTIKKLNNHAKATFQFKLSENSVEILHSSVNDPVLQGMLSNKKTFLRYFIDKYDAKNEARYVLMCEADEANKIHAKKIIQATLLVCQTMQSSEKAFDKEKLGYAAQVLQAIEVEYANKTELSKNELNQLKAKLIAVLIECMGEVPTASACSFFAVAKPKSKEDMLSRAIHRLMQYVEMRLGDKVEISNVSSLDDKASASLTVSEKTATLKSILKKPNSQTTTSQRQVTFDPAITNFADASTPYENILFKLYPDLNKKILAKQNKANDHQDRKTKASVKEKVDAEKKEAFDQGWNCYSGLFFPASSNQIKNPPYSPAVLGDVIMIRQEKSWFERLFSDNDENDALINTVESFLENGCFFRTKDENENVYTFQNNNDPNADAIFKLAFEKAKLGKLDHAARINLIYQAQKFNSSWNKQATHNLTLLFQALNDLVALDNRSLLSRFINRQYNKNVPLYRAAYESIIRDILGAPGDVLDLDNQGVDRHVALIKQAMLEEYKKPIVDPKTGKESQFKALPKYNDGVSARSRAYRDSFCQTVSEIYLKAFSVNGAIRHIDQVLPKDVLGKLAKEDIAIANEIAELKYNDAPPVVNEACRANVAGHFSQASLRPEQAIKHVSGLVEVVDIKGKGAMHSKVSVNQLGKEIGRRSDIITELRAAKAFSKDQVNQLKQLKAKNSEQAEKITELEAKIEELSAIIKDSNDKNASTQSVRVSDPQTGELNRNSLLNNTDVNSSSSTLVMEKSSLNN